MTAFKFIASAISTAV